MINENFSGLSAERENMSRFVDIDNEKFWDILFDEACVEGKQAERIKNELEKIVAFDTEKVVADLEYQKEQCEKDMKYYEEKSWKDHISHTNYDLFYAKSDCWEDAIEIVKRGGIK